MDLCEATHPTLDLRCELPLDHKAPAHWAEDEDGNPHAWVPAAPVDFDSYTVAELRKLAKQAGHTGYSNLNRAQLIDLLSS